MDLCGPGGDGMTAIVGQIPNRVRRRLCRQQRESDNRRCRARARSFFTRRPIRSSGDVPVTARETSNLISRSIYSLSTTTRCVRRRACWANTRHSGCPPADGRDRGTISDGRTTPTKYRYPKCKYGNTVQVSRERSVQRGKQFRKSMIIIIIRNLTYFPR